MSLKNQCIYGRIKVLMGKTGDSTAKAVNHMLIQTYWGKRSMKVWKLVYLW